MNFRDKPLKEFARPVNFIQKVEKWARYISGGAISTLGVLSVMTGNPLGIPLIAIGGGVGFMGHALNHRVEMNNALVEAETQPQQTSANWFSKKAEELEAIPYATERSIGSTLVVGSALTIAAVVAGVNWMWAVPGIFLASGLNAFAEYWLRKYEIIQAQETIIGIPPKEKSKAWFLTAAFDIVDSAVNSFKNPITGPLLSLGRLAQTFFNYRTHNTKITPPAPQPSTT